MKARSESSSNNQAFHGRLNAMDGDGWCSSLPNSNGEWLQVDIGIIIQACGLATQGNKKWFFKRRWVTAFKLSYSLDGTNWETYRNITGGEMVRFKEGAFPIFNLKGERTALTKLGSDRIGSRIGKKRALKNKKEIVIK